MDLPDSGCSADDLAPALIANRSPVTTGDGMPHTAMLLAIGFVRVETGSAHPS